METGWPDPAAIRFLLLAFKTDGSFLSAFVIERDILIVVIPILLATGPLFFIVIFTLFRNKERRYQHEKKTPVQMSNLHKSDEFIERIKQKDSDRLEGANNDRLEGDIVQSSNLNIL